ncbi:MAG: hypothetical protein RMJ59_05065 [Candidatus Nitrosocaldus sp.]|nr:hypothetical protein [Candidatus Nitrosocaldus sp.]MDW8275733.1 hypothetical protein [Candidatus Nitrosocaldus sp.]
MSIDLILAKVVNEARSGLVPDALAFWYSLIIERTRALCSEELRDKVSVEQDEILPMKFRLNVSKRAVPLLLKVIDDALGEMPYSTRLYFETVYNIVAEEYRKAGGVL